jgi:hypothetical protein
MLQAAAARSRSRAGGGQTLTTWSLHLLRRDWALVPGVMSPTCLLSIFLRRQLDTPTRRLLESCHPPACCQSSCDGSSILQQGVSWTRCSWHAFKRCSHPSCCCGPLPLPAARLASRWRSAAACGTQPFAATPRWCHWCHPQCGSSLTRMPSGLSRKVGMARNRPGSFYPRAAVSNSSPKAAPCHCTLSPMPAPLLAWHTCDCLTNRFALP